MRLLIPAPQYSQWVTAINCARDYPEKQVILEGRTVIAIADALAAIASQGVPAAPSPVVPDGCKLVPICLTPDMRTALLNASGLATRELYTMLLAAAPNLAACATSRVPLTDEQVSELIHTKHFARSYVLRNSDLVCLDWYRLGLRDGETAHGISASDGGTNA